MFLILIRELANGQKEALIIDRKVGRENMVELINYAYNSKLCNNGVLSPDGIIDFTPMLHMQLYSQLNCGPLCWFEKMELHDFNGVLRSVEGWGGLMGQIFS